MREWWMAVRDGVSPAASIAVIWLGLSGGEMLRSALVVYAALEIGRSIRKIGGE